MTDYNRLSQFSGPVAPEGVVNHLAGPPPLPPGHPSNMLRSLRDYIPENTSLPPPQFPFDPRSMSMMNMLRGALGTSANWLEGTHNQNAVQVGQDTLSPLGLFTMGTGLANAMTRPPKGAVGHIPADAPMHRAGDGGGVTRFDHVLEQPKHRLVRENDNAPGPYAVMADNAKGSVPGTVVNSLADTELPAHIKKLQRQSQYADAKLQRAEEKKAAWAAKRPRPPETVTEDMAIARRLAEQFPDEIAGGHMMAVPIGVRVNDGTGGWRVTSMPSSESAKQGIKQVAEFGVKLPGAGRPVNDLLADNSRSSVPGVVVNSMGEPQQGIRGVHYTTADFDKFDPKQFGGTGDAFGVGVYSTPMDFAHAQRAKSSSNAYSYGDRFEDGARSIPTEHHLSSPFRIDMPDDVGAASKADWASLRQNWLGPKWKHDMAPYEAAEAGLFKGRDEAGKAFNDALRAHGRDGVTVFDGGVMREVMAMEPGRVKSATTGETLFSDGPRSSVPGTAANATQDDSGVTDILRKYGLLDDGLRDHDPRLDQVEASPPPVIGHTPGKPQMPEDMAPPALDAQGYLQALGAGAIDPFGVTSRGLNALGFEHPARRLTEMRAEYPVLADMGGVLGPGGVLGKAGGMAFKEFAPHLLGLAGQVPVISGTVRDAFSPLRPSPRAQAGYPREGAY
jgi:hypothetical protein